MKHVHSVFNLSCEDDDGEFDTLSDLGPDDSGSHNESTDNESHQPIADGAGSAADEPMPLAGRLSSCFGSFCLNTEDTAVQKARLLWRRSGVDSGEGIGSKAEAQAAGSIHPTVHGCL